MKNRVGGRWGLLFGLLGAVAGAQESQVGVAPEFRPTLALLEVVATDAESQERAHQLELELLSILTNSEQFELAASPATIREEHAALAVNCSELDCFETALDRLGVQRVARLTVEKYATGSRVTFLGLVAPFSDPVRVEVDVEDEGDLEFPASALPGLQAAFETLAVPNGKLVVENADPGLPVLLGGEPVGLGRVEIIRPAGPLVVSIGGSIYEPFDRVVTVKPAEVTTVELRLIARPVTPIVVKQRYAGLMSRPGTYLTMTGLTMVGAGTGLGIATLLMRERLAQSGSPVPVTRVDAMNAPAQAVLATFLLAAGVTLSAGGIAWVLLTPSSPSPGVDEPAGPGDAKSWTLSFGGTL